MTKSTSKPAKSRAKAPAAKAKPAPSKAAPRAGRRKAPEPDPESTDDAGAEPASTSHAAEGLETVLSALSFALDKKALEPVLLDVRQLCSFCNYQLIVSGRSDRQVDAISDGISAGLRDRGVQPIGKEGAKTGQWALLDYGDFVVHVFLHAARESYDLEGLWNDAPRVEIQVPEEAKLRTVESYA